MGLTSVSRWCPSLETVNHFCQAETLEATVCFLMVEIHGLQLKLGRLLLPPFLEKFGVDQESLNASVSSKSLSQTIFLLDLCGVSGIVLVFPVNTTVNDMSCAMWNSFTSSDPLVDLRDDLAVIAVCPEQNQMNFLMRITSVSPAEVLLTSTKSLPASDVTKSPASDVTKSPIITYASIQAKKDETVTISMRLYNVRDLAVLESAVTDCC